MENSIDCQDQLGSQRVGIIGLGKLGAPMAACFASRGYQVLAADLDATKVQALNNGVAPVNETGLSELIQQNKDRLSATTNVSAVVQETDLVFVIVPTPSNEQGIFSNDYLKSACEVIGTALKNKSTKSIIIITSTVMPGSTGGLLQSTLEKASGKKCGKDFGLCYSPEFIALGSVIHDFLHPDFYLIGESDPKSGSTLGAFYKSICRNDAPLARMDFVSAELAKISINSFITTKISFANTLARLCEKIPGAHVDRVTHALGLDTRIGAKYLKGSIGYGGPCFPRDNVALGALARSVGLKAWISESTDRVNHLQLDALYEAVGKRVAPPAVVGILGLAYKPNTEVVEESSGLELAEMLVKVGYRVLVYDTHAMETSHARLGSSVEYANGAIDCIERSQLAIVMQPCNEFKELTAEIKALSLNGHMIVDCWRIFENFIDSSNAQYVPLGIGLSPSVIPNRNEGFIQKKSTDRSLRPSQ